MDQIGCFRHWQHVVFLAVADLEVGREPERLFADTVADDLLQTHKCSTDDEQNVGGVNLEEFLVRMLTTTLGRNVSLHPL